VPSEEVNELASLKHQNIYQVRMKATNVYACLLLQQMDKMICYRRREAGDGWVDLDDAAIGTFVSPLLSRRLCVNFALQTCSVFFSGLYGNSTPDPILS
jgi:hypothetical protein